MAGSTATATLEAIADGTRRRILEESLLVVGGRPMLRLERRLSRPLSEVWKAATDPAEMCSWFPTHIEMEEWKVGAAVTHHFDGSDLDPLPETVLKWEPPARASFTLGEDVITFELSPSDAGGTIFVLAEELSANHVARNAAGWDSCLDRLEFGEEKEAGAPRFDRYAAELTSTLGQREGPPVGPHRRSE
jgi:uncharacterized protein YndB with AHSA1/START domain